MNATSVLSTLTSELSEGNFQTISELVRQSAGINLHQGKKELVKARLVKRLRSLGIGGFDEYIDYLRADSTGNELVQMLDVISTNLTSFFREVEHFDFLSSNVFAKLPPGGRLRVWSAGCSSGEEPFSLAIAVREHAPIPSPDVKILATDISTAVLHRARQGQYTQRQVRTVPPPLLARYFTRTRGQEPVYCVNDSLSSLVQFARLNLMEPWPMKGPLDVIMCRNVMIYFDKPTQQTLIQRFHDLLPPGGHLLIGHSESLAGVQHKFQYVRPTIYQKR